MAGKNINVLILGKAKTGTTALASAVRATLGSCHLCMEPKSIFDLSDEIRKVTEQHVIAKIIFEHFFTRLRHLNAIIHQELNVSVDRLILLRRDFRDEMISRLMYFSFVLPKDDMSPLLWERWISELQRKEEHPRSISFFYLCQVFKDIFAVDVWDDIVRTHMQTSVTYRKFIEQSVHRDNVKLDYEDMIDGKLDAVSDYLGVPLRDSINTVDLGNYSYTRRSARYGNWREFFTDEDVILLRPIFDKKFGSEAYSDWSLQHPSCLDSQLYSEYVRRMALGRNTNSSIGA